MQKVIITDFLQYFYVEQVYIHYQIENMGLDDQTLLSKTKIQKRLLLSKLKRLKNMKI